MNSSSTVDDSAADVKNEERVAASEWDPGTTKTLKQFRPEFDGIGS